MLQPPWDSSLKAENGKDAYIIHFTYGNDFNESGKFTPGKVGFWHWDKRDYTDKYPPMNFPLPPEGCTNEAVKHLVSAVNEAAAHLPGWAERSFNDVSEVEFAYGDEEEEEEEIPDEDPEGEVYEDENDVIEEGEGDSGWGEEDLAEDAR